MAEGNTWNKECPICKTAFVGESCPECAAAQAAVPTKVIPRANLFADAIKESPSTHLLPPGAEFQKGDKFHGLEILSIAGRGGMGAVFKARQVTLDRMVALKVLPTDKSNIMQFRDRFHREAKTLATLSHPNIVGIHDFGEESGVFFFVMEYVDGMDLHDYISRKKPGMEEIRAIFSQICDALDYAHSMDVVHRDIKPANILVDQNGRVKVADFGLAKFAEHGKMTLLTATGAGMGTAHFVAPEQMRDAVHVDHRADLYSMGAMLYQMLTGEIPVGVVEPPSKISHTLAPFDPIIKRAMEKKPESRYQHASELKSDVEKASSGEIPVLPEKKSRVLPRLAILIFVLLVGGYFLYREIDSKKAVVPSPDINPNPIEASSENGNDLLEAFMSAASYSAFKPITNDEMGEIQDLVLRLSNADPRKVMEYLREEISPLQKPWERKEWLDRKKEAKKRLTYSKFLTAILPKDSIFDQIVADLTSIGNDMLKILAWKGQFDLRIIPSPYAEVVEIKFNGKVWNATEGIGHPSPVTLGGLPVGSWTFILEHPNLGRQEVEIPDTLEPGKVYVLSGKVGQIELRGAP